MSELKTLATSLIQQTNPSLSSNPEANRIAISQTQHRLNLLTAWFGSLDAAKTGLSGKMILEIGCGQGDMTVALAWAVGPTGKVYAIDPAPLDYGSPETLQQAQERVSRSEIGGRIIWVQADPVEALGVEARLGEADYVVLAHSLLYMRSGEYLGELFGALRRGPKMSEASASLPELLIAEWGMRVSNESAKAHLLAVQAQAARPLESGNVQLYLEPKVTVGLASKAGWKSEREKWVESPAMDDGAWEVAAAKSVSTDNVDGDARGLLDEMKRVLVEPTKCMDVWTSVLH